MHPLEASANSEMFQDILDLEIRSDYDEDRPKVKSICFPSSAVIFEQSLWSRFDMNGSSLNRTATSRIEGAERAFNPYRGLKVKENFVPPAWGQR
jgi:hypothetical protein